MIDNADKDKKCAKFDKNFSIKVYMNKIDEFEFKAKMLKVDKKKPKKRSKSVSEKDGSDDESEEEDVMEDNLDD